MAPCVPALRKILQLYGATRTVIRNRFQGKVMLPMIGLKVLEAVRAHRVRTSVAPVSSTYRTYWGSHVLLSAVLGLFLIYL